MGLALKSCFLLPSITWTRPFVDRLSFFIPDMQIWNEYLFHFYCPLFITETFTFCVLRGFWRALALRIAFISYTSTFGGGFRREWSSTAVFVVKLTAEGRTSQASVFRCFPRQSSTTFSMTLPGAMKSYIQVKRVCPARESNSRPSAFRADADFIETLLYYIFTVTDHNCFLPNNWLAYEAKVTNAFRTLTFVPLSVVIRGGSIKHNEYIWINIRVMWNTHEHSSSKE